MRTDAGGTLTLTRFTEPDGSYLFNNLPAGTYKVTETQPAGYLDGIDSRNGTLIAGSKSTDVVSSIGVVANTNSPNNNFGEIIPGALSGIVYNDCNNNGDVDLGEMGIPNTTVTLTGTDDLGAVSKTATTDAAGFYF